MDAKKTVDSARKRFDPILHTEAYRSAHSDDAQLEGLLGLFPADYAGSCLDLGTGNGYVAFAAARRFPRARLRGLDVAAGALLRDAAIASESGIHNLGFDAYDGIVLPYGDSSFDGAVSRYAFHHFPDPARSIAELARILEPGGFFILSDPRRPEEDAENFIDAYQSLMPDGHVHFYGRQEIDSLFSGAGFRIEAEFDSSARYPREYDSRYEGLIGKAGEDIRRLYKIEVSRDRVFIEVPVMNLLLRRDPAAAARPR